MSVCKISLGNKIKFDWRLKIMDRNSKIAKIVTLTSYLTTSVGRDHTHTHTNKQAHTDIDVNMQICKQLPAGSDKKATIYHAGSILEKP